MGCTPSGSPNILTCAALLFPHGLVLLEMSLPDLAYPTNVSFWGRRDRRPKMCCPLQGWLKPRHADLGMSPSELLWHMHPVLNSSSASRFWVRALITPICIIHTHTYIYIHIYIYVYTYIYICMCPSGLNHPVITGLQAASSPQPGPDARNTRPVSRASVFAS